MKHDFLVGAATAAHQVEGNNIHSDLWVQENLPHSTFTEPSLDAVDHYNRYREDIQYLADAGMNAYRFSIEWARIEPKRGVYDRTALAHYKDVLMFCHEKGITPIVTMHHFSSPAWLIAKGGWKKKYVIKAFAQYCAYVVSELGHLMPYVCTINEANMGYQIYKLSQDVVKSFKGEGDVQIGIKLDIKVLLKDLLDQGRAFRCNPFGVNTFISPREQKHELIVMQAHQAAVEAIHRVSSKTKVGITLSLWDYQPVDGGEAAAAALWQEEFGFYLPHLKNDDFLGVQNYSRKLVGPEGGREPAQGVRCTQMGYEDYPQSIGNVLRKVSKEFHGDLIVTENGIGTDDDQRRCAFIEEATASVSAAQADGVPVKGYMCWSLLDNFEWQAGFSKTFGLIAVDRKTQTRYPKESLAVLGRIAKQWHGADMEATFDEE